MSAEAAAFSLRARDRRTRRLGELRPLAPPDQDSTVPWLVLMLFIGALAGGQAFVLLDGPLRFVAAVVLFVLPTVLWGAFRTLTARWWVAGAGLPTLELAGGELRGRVRPVYGRDVATADPTDPGWWDFRLPVTQIVGVRVVPHRTAGPALVVDLPPEVAEPLLRADRRDSPARQNHTLTSSPAAWWLGYYETRAKRAQLVSEALAAFSQSGVPVSRA